MRYVGFFVMSILLSGCTASYQVNNTTRHVDTQPLDHKKLVYVAVPRDGAYGSKIYHGSGQIVAHAVASAFSGVGAQVHVADIYQPQSENISVSNDVGAGYLVVPAIAHWEQRATEWSGRPSRMTIRLTIVDVETGLQVTSTSIEGRSRIISFTPTTPESLLRDPIMQYVHGLY